MLRPALKSRFPCSNVLRGLIGALLLSLGATAPANTELPALGADSLINIERETRLGRSVYNQLQAEGLLVTHPLLDRYINDLGFRLLGGLDNRVRDYRFFILRSDRVNAFALPGGYIGVNFGLIMQSQTQHQLASVLAHEIAHVELRHGLDMMEKSKELSTKALAAILAGFFLSGADSQAGAALMYGGIAGSEQAMVNFTRENEYEADRIGVELLSSAGFDPTGMVEFFGIMGKLSGGSELDSIEYLRTHPVSNNRVAEAMSRAAKLPRGRNQVDDFELFKDYLLYASSDHLPVQGSAFLQALALMNAAQHEQADESLESLYRRDNENIWFGIAYAENLESLGRGDEAEQVYRHLLKIFPGDYVLSLRLLQLLKQLGRDQAALTVARAMEKQYPGEKQVYFELSDIYRALQKPALRLMAEAEFHSLSGNADQAIKLYDQVLKSTDVDLATESRAREKRFQLLKK